jgi:hypothetical protein
MVLALIGMDLLVVAALVPLCYAIYNDRRPMLGLVLSQWSSGGVEPVSLTFSVTNIGGRRARGLRLIGYAGEVNIDTSLAFDVPPHGGEAEAWLGVERRWVEDLYRHPVMFTGTLTVKLVDRHGRRVLPVYEPFATEAQGR